MGEILMYSMAILEEKFFSYMKFIKPQKTENERVLESFQP